MIHPQRKIRFVSGGQTGVDRAGLDAALELGLPIGGWCPKGRLAEDGAIDKSYPLKETETPNRSSSSPSEAVSFCSLIHSVPS